MFKTFIGRRRFLRDFKGKTKAGINLKVEVIQLMAKARGIEAEDVKIVLRRLLSESIDSKDSELYQKITTLLNSLDVIAPYSEFPSEVRYSLAEIKELIDSSELGIKESVLCPILQNMAEHENLKKKYQLVKLLAAFLYMGVILQMMAFFWVYIYECNSHLSSVCRAFGEIFPNLP